MAKKHEWETVGIAHQQCKVCGAKRFGKPGGWGRAMNKDFTKSVRYCEDSK